MSSNKILNLCKLLNNVSLRKNEPIVSCIFSRNISTTTRKFDLMEFFDDQKNWGANDVKVGRAWKKDEMRLKSNVDLHKLWYVLLKERNMLLTMEQEANEQVQLFPSPERLDKVEESMENLEAVIRERNKAYHELETGETGERPGKHVTSRLGLRYYYKMSEHVVPKHMNTKWQQKYQFYKYDRDVEAFLLKYNEKLYLTKKRKQRRDFNHVIGLLKRFPGMDMEALKQQYPDVDIEKAKHSRKCRGHFEP
ncbi:39S ribosomal protein L47, mitochondrial [Sitophilus oryzae]|uniref:Large ribosomal subunit protein uL29m n=1 Tax=Sitophilus oryzae TaxID=7048 RepID=A0A6J2Y5D0_SITOR|nr:39S ribosomal protein L47, mitochondrial [Sitophilus oryzae]